MQLSRTEANPLALNWWVEIITAQPIYIYYFGFFASLQAAQLSQSGYLEDLKGEGAQSIRLQIERCQPQTLTIFEDELELDSLTNDALCTG